MKVNLNHVIPLVESAIELNLSKLREEPDSDGETHDNWEDESEWVEELKEKLSDFVEVFNECNSLRSSLGRINIEIKK